MKAFAALLDGLVFAPQRNVKLRLMETYFRNTPDPERGCALAALTGDLAFRHAKPSLVRALATGRVDPELFALSHDFIGDLAETVALIWPSRASAEPAPALSEVVETLARADRPAISALLEEWLDRLDAGGRYALLKLITGELRVGVSARLAKTALAAFGGVSVSDIEELWHGLRPPYIDLFRWLEGHSGPPRVSADRGFRPLMLANPIEEADLLKLDPSEWLAEWKWDGIRVQLTARGGHGRVCSRTGDDIGGAFPDIAELLTFDAVLDGELLVAREGEVASFNDLQQRLGRKAASASLRAGFPAHVRLYDILVEGEEDVRSLPFVERRRRLEAWFARERPRRMDLSPLVAFTSWRCKDSPYIAGRPKGHWFKWKRDPLTVDCVLMYAQRGHGKRSSYYSDYTFGCWRDGANGASELVPVGKAYFGFTDRELLELDRWVRAHTVERFGPVRAVQPELVLEIAFDSVHPSARHKSGVAMRFPRVHRIRWDKPAVEADCLETLTALVKGRL